MANKAPSHTLTAKSGRTDREGKDVYTEVGAAWPLQNSSGFSVRINVLPVPFDGVLFMHERRDD